MSETLLFPIIGGVIGFLVLVFSFRSKSPKYNLGDSPNITISHNGIEGHYDFLESHGFMSSEERKAQRDLEKEYKEHPENFKSYTLSELMEEFDKKQSPDTLKEGVEK